MVGLVENGRWQNNDRKEIMQPVNASTIKLGHSEGHWGKVGNKGRWNPGVDTKVASPGVVHA